MNLKHNAHTSMAGHTSKQLVLVLGSRKNLTLATKRTSLDMGNITFRGTGGRGRYGKYL